MNMMEALNTYGIYIVLFVIVPLVVCIIKQVK